MDVDDDEIWRKRICERYNSDLKMQKISILKDKKGIFRFLLLII